MKLRERDLIESDQYAEPENLVGFEWMTRVCECSHVDRIHGEDGTCGGWVLSSWSRWRCPCRGYVHQPHVDVVTEPVWKPAPKEAV